MLESRQGIWSEVSERHMIIYCLVLQSTTWMSSACTDRLGHGCANDGLWHPVCSSSLACCLSLLSDYADKTVLAAAQDQVRGLDLQNAFFFVKKKTASFSWSHFPDVFHSLSPQTPVLAKLQGHCTAAWKPEEEQGMERNSNTSRHYCHWGQGTTELQPYNLLLAWLRFTLGFWKVTWHSSTSVPGFLTL